MKLTAGSVAAGYKGVVMSGRELVWSCSHSHNNANDARECARLHPSSPLNNHREES